MEDERIPSFFAERFFTDKQWDALCENIPMTQEIFDKCLDVCHQVKDGVMFHRIIKQFPDLAVNFEFSIQEKYKLQYEDYKSEYLKKWGKDAVYFIDEDE